MTKIGNFNSNIGDFPIKEKNTVVKELDNKSNSISYSQDILAQIENKMLITTLLKKK
jgi:hypothetical protein